MLEIRLLGQFDVRLDGRPVDIPSRAAQLLLAYLLLNVGTPQRREKLCGQFWPDALEGNARSNLRHAVWRLRKALEVQAASRDYLLADSFSIAWNADANYWLDTAVLETAAQTGSLDEQAAALDVYRGELLPGFYEDWVSLERERLAAIFAQRAQALLDGLAVAGRWTDAVTWAERWIALGQAPEPAFRALMQAHGAAGDLAAVAASFQRCQEALLRDLGVEPSEQTRLLFEALRQPSRSGRAAAPVLSEDPNRQSLVPANQLITAPTASGLPALSTTFVGRERELRLVGERLSDPNCRLLTLIGPGGIGKTRLAIQAAAHADQFKDGVQFVRLSAVNNAETLVSAVAEALGFTFYGRDDPTAQLIDYLRPRRQLLLLDNFEHLLDGAGIVTTILQHAPGVKFLVTSQERLNLQDEWLLEVEGLPIPEGEGVGAGEAAGYGAVQLFIESARRVEAGFQLRPDELPAVVRICRLVAGTPLGIELAAAWVRTISIPEIAQEIERSAQFLSTSQRDRPERHRSLQAVFDHSWNRLSEGERRLFCRLSLFSGGFGREAAEQVAGASLADLSALVDKSLLRRLGTGRYAMHGLLREFAQAKLAVLGETQTIRERHLDFYLQMAEQAEAGLRGPDQLDWLRRLDLEHDNLRRALKWAAEANVIAGQRLAGNLARYWYLRGNWREGREWLTLMLSQTSTGDGATGETDCAKSARAKALMGAGWLADDDGSEEPFYRQSLELCRAVGDDWGAAYSLRGLGSTLFNDGNLAQSTALLQESLTIFEARRDAWGVGLVRHILGWVAFGRDDHPRAQAIWTAGLEDFRHSGDRWGIAVTLGALAYLARQRTEYALASALYENSLDLFRELGDRAGVAMSLLRLARIAFRRSNYPLALALIGESQAAQVDMGDQRGQVNAKSLLGVIYCYQGRYELATAVLAECWQIATGVGGEGYDPFILAYLGLVSYRQGNLAQAAAQWERALAILQGRNDRLGIAYSLWGLGIVALSQDDFQRASERLDQSVTLFREQSDHFYLGMALDSLARAELALGRSQHALQLAHDSVTQRKYSADRQGLAESFETLATLWTSAVSTNLERAAELFGLAEALREAVGAPLAPVEREAYADAVGDLRRKMEANAGETAFTAAWDRGRSLAAAPLEAMEELAAAT